MSIRAASPALLAALLFGASTPLAKALIGSVAPLLLAGLLGARRGSGRWQWNTTNKVLARRELRTNTVLGRLRLARYHFEPTPSPGEGFFLAHRR